MMALDAEIHRLMCEQGRGDAIYFTDEEIDALTEEADRHHKANLKILGLA